jgi:gluconokinase
MPTVDGFRSPYDKKAGGLHHLGRMIDKIRLMQSGQLPEDFRANYGLSVGLDGHLCGFLNVPFKEIEARVAEGGSDDEIVEWIFSRGLRPNKMQARIWNECSRKFGWSDALSKYIQRWQVEGGFGDRPECTSFDLIELQEGRAE